MEYYVYILSNKTNSVLYVGVTNNLVKRVFEHKSKVIEGFTKKYNINKLIYYEITTDIYSAITREKQIKSWNRKRKIDLIATTNPDFKELDIV
ncbi:MAG: GIY-YIG nuclease family protein [Clostridia bacterium]|nr:GIY-YIG nuclease family protein [Clostridia bacterium]